MHWKEEIKVSDHRWHDHLCRKSKNWKKKTLLELISNYSKPVRYKANIQETIAFLYTSSEQVEFEIKNTILFTLVKSW